MTAPVWRNAVVSSDNGWLWRIEFNSGSTYPGMLVRHDRQYVVGNQQRAERIAVRRLARANRREQRHRVTEVAAEVER